MTGSIDFRYDPRDDIVFATPHWRIENMDDVLAWYRQYSDYFGFNFPERKVDLVLDLGDFQVSPSIAARWGEYRARMNTTYTRHSCRVSADSRVRLHVLTSAARHDATAHMDEAPTVEEAVEAIKAARRSQGA